MALWKVSNLTSTACLSRRKYDLNKVMDTMRDAKGVKSVKFNQKRFCGLCVKFENPKATVLIFESGRIVCVGVSHHSCAREAFNQCARILNDEYIRFRVHNYVVNWNVGTMIKLDQMARNNRENASYEPELFPGCIYKHGNGIKVTLFATGKVFVTGIRDARSIDRVYHEVMKVLNIATVSERGHQNELN